MIVDAAVSAVAIQAGLAVGVDAAGASDAVGAEVIAAIVAIAIIITADAIFRPQNMPRLGLTMIARRSRCPKAIHR